VFRRLLRFVITNANRLSTATLFVQLPVLNRDLNFGLLKVDVHYWPFGPRVVSFLRKLVQTFLMFLPEMPHEVARSAEHLFVLRTE
jgi:hypothetical protein